MAELILVIQNDPDAEFRAELQRLRERGQHDLAELSERAYACLPHARKRKRARQLRLVSP